MKLLIVCVLLICSVAAAQLYNNQINGGNLRLENNTLSSTDTNGDINLTPDGTGTVISTLLQANLFDVDNLRLNGNAITSTDTNGNITVLPDGTGSVNLSIGFSSNLSFTTITVPFRVGDGNGDVTHTISGVPIDSAIEVHSEGGTDPGGIAIHRHTDNNALGGHILSLRSRGTHASPTIIQDNNIINRIVSTAYDGTDYEQLTEIRSEIDGTPGSNDMPGRLLFLTTPDGSATISERMRIDSNGNVGINGAANASALLDITSTSKGSKPWPSMTGAQRDAISTPATGLTIYNTDTDLVNIYNGSQWQPLSDSGGVGGINYLENDSFNFENLTVGDWVAYADAAATTPADGTGGSPNITFNSTISASEIIRGNGSGEITKDAADRQGEGISIDFSVDNQDLGKELTISFDYVTDVNYVSGDMKVFVYDVTGTTLLSVLNDDDGDILATNLSFGRFIGTFQTDNTNKSYRLILHIASTNASAYGFLIDNVKVGPSDVVPGAIVSKAQNFTPNFTNFTLGNGTVEEAWWMREGQFMIGRVLVTLGSTSSMGSGPTIDVPNSQSIDSDLMDLTSNESEYGQGIIVDSGTTTYKSIATSSGSATTIALFSLNSSANLASISSTTPMTWTTSDKFEINFKVPISGWDSGALVSTTQTLFSTDRVSSGAIPTGTLTGSFNTTIFGSVNFNTSGAYDTSTGVYTVPRTGYYMMSAHIENTFTSGTPQIGVRFQNTTTPATLGTAVHRVTTADTAASVDVTTMAYLTKGDTVEVQSYNNGTSPVFANTFAGNYFSITQLPDLSAFSVYNQTEVVEASSGLASYSITADQQGDLASISLTPGEWDLTGQALYFSNGATTTTNVHVGISTTSGNSTTGLNLGDNWMIADKGTSSGTYTPITISGHKITVTSDTTYYLKARASTSTTNLEVAYRITARKIK